MRYRVVCYMRVEPEEALFDSRAEAEEEVAHERFLFPENRYEVEEAEE